MAGVGAVVDAVFGSYDLKYAKQWRDEDIQYREQEKQWREDAILREIAWRNSDLERERRVFKLENEKRIIDARLKQLTAISQLSALLAAFSMVSIMEINLPSGLNHYLMFFYGTVCCLEFIFTLLAMLICMLLLLAVTRFVTHTLEGEVRALHAAELELVSPFTDWWLKKCETEWVMAYRLFRWGASFFLLEILALGWVQFGESKTTAITITVISLLCMLYYRVRFVSKWRYLGRYPEQPSPVNPTVVGDGHLYQTEASPMMGNDKLPSTPLPSREPSPQL